MTREELRAIILDGEDGVESCQSYIDSLIHTAAMTALRMTSKISFSHEEKIEAFQFAIDIMERLYVDGNVGFYAVYLSLFYSMRRIKNRSSYLLRKRYVIFGQDINFHKLHSQSCSDLGKKR